MRIVPEHLVESTKTKILAHVMVEPLSGCWIWERGYFGHKKIGFARPAIHIPGIGQHAVYRISFELFRNEIQDGLHVCHKCDTTACVNPSHVFTGTRSDNMQDGIRKGRVNKPRKLARTANCA